MSPGDRGWTDLNPRRNGLRIGNHRRPAPRCRGDCRPSELSKGSLIDVYARNPWINRALPAMGYSPAQLEDLRATIAAANCDSIIVATPVDLGRLIDLPIPACRVRYDLEEIGHPGVAEILSTFLAAQANRLKK